MAAHPDTLELSRPNRGKRRFALVFATAALLLLPAWGASAHEETHPIGGGMLGLMDPPLKPEKRKFVFKSKGQLSINDVTADLTTATSSLIVRGLAATDGSSGVIHLAPSGWKMIGKPTAPKGWKYKADWRDPSSAGLAKLVIKTHPSRGGKLMAKAKGQYWPYQILMVQATIEVSVTLAGETYCAEFSDFRKNQGGKVVAKNAVPPADCTPVCGNGRLELGEECDDGNADTTDTCSLTCEGCADAAYEGTFAALQELVFDSPVYQCSNELCHGANASGDLDLRAESSHASLINVGSQIDPGVMLVSPGDQELSMLYNKLAAKTLGTSGVPGTPMPANAETVSEDLLETLAVWIRGGAPETGVVEGTAELLEACLPQPSPAKMPRPPAPEAGTGIQFAFPPWHLPAQDEFEGCVPFYFDLTAEGVVPEQYRRSCSNFAPGTNDTGECVAVEGLYVAQDPQSHHAIMRLYKGDYDWDDPGWGAWTCHGGDNAGAPCTPGQPGEDPQCPGGVCGGETREGLACISIPNFGPPDWGLAAGTMGGITPQYIVSQESTRQVNYPPGVYSRLPLKGIMVWNSHAFNLTEEDMDVEGWLNVDFADVQDHNLKELFDATFIFTQDVPAFEQREYCATHKFTQGTKLFQLTSHTHQRGKHFRMWAPPQETCGSFEQDSTGFSQLVTDPDCQPGDPEDLFYESYEYTDPVELTWPDEPWDFTGTVADRTIRYCALYDNGYTDPADVKRQSTSPNPPDAGIPNQFLPGGPCSDEEVKCMGGDNKGQLCFGNDANCPDSECDACDLFGGVTTEDEMFIIFGYFFKE